MFVLIGLIGGGAIGWIIWRLQAGPAPKIRVPKEQPNIDMRLSSLCPVEDTDATQ